MDNPYAPPASRAEAVPPSKRVASKLWMARLLFWPLGGIWLLNGIGALEMFFIGPSRAQAQLSPTALLLLVIEAVFVTCLGVMLVYAGTITSAATVQAGKLARGVAWAAVARNAFNILSSALSVGGTGRDALDNTGLGVLVGAFVGFGFAAAIHATGTWLLDQARRDKQRKA